MHRWSSFYRKRSTTSFYVCMYVCMYVPTNCIQRQPGLIKRRVIRLEFRRNSYLASALIGVGWHKSKVERVDLFTARRVGEIRSQLRYC